MKTIFASVYWIVGDAFCVIYSFIFIFIILYLKVCSNNGQWILLALI